MFTHIDASTWPMLGIGTLQTFFITLSASLLAYSVGLPLGVLLVVTGKEGLKPIIWLNKILGVIVNILRSVPFIILMVFVIPLTRLLVGTSIGTVATIPPLFIAAFPFVARLVESSLLEVDNGIIEAAWSMGSSPFKIITKVMIPEAKPSLLLGATIAVTTILAYTAMAGAVGGGGLGDIAIRYGYNRYQTDIMFITVVELAIIVMALQALGERWAKKTDRRLRTTQATPLMSEVTDK
jgi:D-methionine transport system permease protein